MENPPFGPGADPPIASSEGAAGATQLVTRSLVFYGSMLAVTGIAAVLSGGSLLFADAGAKARGISWTRDIGLGLGIAAVVVVASAELTRRAAWARELAIAFATVLGPLGWRHSLVLAAASGIAEEALFRGLLQPWLGYALTSVVFGAIHFVPRREFLPWTLFSIAAGFLLGGLFIVTGNLVAPVVAHAGINAVNLRLLGSRWLDAAAGEAS